MIRLINLRSQYENLKPETDRVIRDVLLSGGYILGENVKKLEKKFAKYIGVKYAVSCASGTDALIIALRACGIKPLDEVITTGFSFFATAEAICTVGATPVFADVDCATGNIDPEEIKKKITKKTKAILPVHLYGQPAQMNKIRIIAKRNRLRVVEDACQAIGAEYFRKKVGSFGDVGCFSFFPTKNLGGCGDGGIITTNNKEIAIIATALRQHGGGVPGQQAYNVIYKKNIDNAQRTKYHNYLIGYNSRLDEIQAAIILVKFKYLDKWNKIRIKNASYYSDKLINTKLETPKTVKSVKGVFNQYVLKSKNRDKIVEYLKSKQIETGVYYPVPLHLQKAFEFLGYKRGDLPTAETLSRLVFSIPVHPDLKEKEKKYIVKSILSFKEK